MIISWIYPKTEKCGINHYSIAYISAIGNLGVEINAIPWSSLRESHKLKDINKSDLVHIQYEPSIFLNKNKDFYPKLCAKINKPLIVTLHEIYETFPGVFPKSKIRGRLKLLKELIYDYRHSAQTAFYRNLNNSFYSDQIIVHHNFQKKILVKKGMSAENIAVSGFPVKHESEYRESKPQKTVQLGCAGFINSQFDYELLFQLLSKLKIKWNFTWVGGVRLSDHNYLQTSIEQKIKQLNWENKFNITGYLDINNYEQEIRKLDVGLCLFSNRSASKSISDMMAEGVIIACSCIEMTEEIAAEYNPVFMLSPNCLDAAAQIEQLSTNHRLRTKIQEGMGHYTKKYSIENLAAKTLNLYKKKILNV
ncbi:glycosyltransferase [Chitinispirillales bacterium ANBcel5]|uniref:hypothetical protein n=1 Tax=Cellulosispirillum alkaliphilum TaxID=3039283 RepID=UPI002A56151E|nr:glycosyltransferase [Chitinispirillales bacterium ANBcel5]